MVNSFDSDFKLNSVLNSSTLRGFKECFFNFNLQERRFDAGVCTSALPASHPRSEVLRDRKGTHNFLSLTHIFPLSSGFSLRLPLQSHSLM